MAPGHQRAGGLGPGGRPPQAQALVRSGCSPDRQRAWALFAATVGLFFGLSLLKWGNPVILASQIKPPRGFWEWVIAAWPVSWGYALLSLVCIWGVVMAGWFSKTSTSTSSSGVTSNWLFWLPLAWLVWQCLSAAQTVSWSLTLPTLKHFAASTACFWLGALILAKAPDLTPMWGGILVGFIGMLAAGFDQHFGGLEETRKLIYSQPDWQSLPPELLKKIASDRIYATLFYPNTLAGVILLFLPVLTTVALQSSRNAVRTVLITSCISLSGIACLFWSGSKAGWLIGLILGLVAWFTSAIRHRTKWIVGIAVTVLGLAIFIGKHGDYFHKGATSLGARLDYWSAAVRIAAKHPFFGSGPGTFQELYRYLRPPEGEMARLVHNDYLEQACDSGIPGSILFGLFTLGSLIVVGRRLSSSPDRIAGAVWLGLLGWALQSVVEFGLYIPALAWPVFLFLGWLLALPYRGRGIQPDSQSQKQET